MSKQNLYVAFRTTNARREKTVEIVRSFRTCENIHRNKACLLNITDTINYKPEYIDNPELAIDNAYTKYTRMNDKDFKIMVKISINIVHQS